jgi:glycosyltransferase involved in cell wall biosynthesis
MGPCDEFQARLRESLLGIVMFSVIIPAYNRADSIERAVRSAIDQAEPPEQVIVVDDGSTDATAEVASGLRSGFSGLSVLRQANQGPGPARNAGIRHARGEYVAFLDSDDRFFPWTLATYRQAIVQHNHPAIVMGNAVWHDDPEPAPPQECPAHFRSWPTFLASLRESPPVTACTMAVRRDVMEKVGGFRPLSMSGEDHDLLYRLGAETGFVRVDAPVTAAYRQAPGTASRDLQLRIAGAKLQLNAWKRGEYPGRSVERDSLIALFARDAAWDAVRAGAFSEAWRLYGASLALQVKHRPRFVAAFPAIAILRRIERMLRSQAGHHKRPG